MPNVEKLNNLKLPIPKMVLVQISPESLHFKPNDDGSEYAHYSIINMYPKDSKYGFIKLIVRFMTITNPSYVFLPEGTIVYNANTSEFIEL